MVIYTTDNSCTSVSKLVDIVAVFVAMYISVDSKFLL
jgi:hypothetical protein